MYVHVLLTLRFCGMQHSYSSVYTYIQYVETVFSADSLEHIGTKVLEVEMAFLDLDDR